VFLLVWMLLVGLMLIWWLFVRWKLCIVLSISRVIGSVVVGEILLVLVLMKLLFVSIVSYEVWWMLL